MLILKNCILFLTDLSDLFIMKNPNESKWGQCVTAPRVIHSNLCAKKRKKMGMHTKTFYRHTFLRKIGIPMTLVVLLFPEY